VLVGIDAVNIMAAYQLLCMRVVNRRPTQQADMCASVGTTKIDFDAVCISERTGHFLVSRTNLLLSHNKIDVRYVSFKKARGISIDRSLEQVVDIKVR